MSDDLDMSLRIIVGIGAVFTAFAMGWIVRGVFERELRKAWLRGAQAKMEFDEAGRR